MSQLFKSEPSLKPTDKIAGKELSRWMYSVSTHLFYAENACGEPVAAVRPMQGQGPIPIITKWSEATMTTALLNARHTGHTWVNMPQFRLFDGGRIIDLLCVSCGEWAGDGSRVGYEIKVSRSDFLSEMKKPEKYLEAMRYVNEFYYVVPEGLVQPSEVPEGAGLIEASQDTRKQWLGRWRAKTKLRASKRDAIIDLHMWKALAANMAKRQPINRDEFTCTVDFTASHTEPHQSALIAFLKDRHERHARLQP